MGKVIGTFTLTNYADLIAKQLKVLKGKPRSVEVEALVDTGVTRLYLKPSIIKKTRPLKDWHRQFPHDEWEP